MDVREPKESEKALFNSLATHPLQAWEWGEFREKTGIKVIRRLFYSSSEAQEKSRSISSRQARTIKPSFAFQLTIHKIPRTNYTIGYIPKGLLPTEEVIEELKRIGREEQCIFIKLEPNIEKSSQLSALSSQLTLSSHPLFTKYTFQIDLTKSEEELLKNMRSKTRYNIRVAQKHGVSVQEDNSAKAFEQYIKLMHETTKRQKYYAHTEQYHRLMWETLKIRNLKLEIRNSQDNLQARLLVARYKGKILVEWILFMFNNVLYYPYGASSSEHRQVMASNLMMWEAIRFGKKIGCKMFDMWGSLGPNPDTKDPWYGFHRFKEGYGGELIEFVGSYDLVLNSLLYQLYNLLHRARWLYLRLKKL